MNHSSTAIDETRAARVLTNAFLRAGEELGLSARALARIVGVSPASLSRMRKGRTIDPTSKKGELSLLFLRVFRSLNTQVGGDHAAARAWFGAMNDHLRGVPAERAQTITGLVQLADYLDAMRGRN